jgi:hypothetical protein
VPGQSDSKLNLQWVTSLSKGSLAHAINNNSSQARRERTFGHTNDDYPWHTVQAPTLHQTVRRHGIASQPLFASGSFVRTKVAEVGFCLRETTAVSIRHNPFPIAQTASALSFDGWFGAIRQGSRR